MQLPDFSSYSLVSTLEKRKKSPSPASAVPSSVPLHPPQPQNIAHIHDDSVDEPTSSFHCSKSDPSTSLPLANSLDLSSDDDVLDKQLSSLTGASSSTTTTTSSSFLDNKAVPIGGTTTTLPGVTELRSSNCSLNKIDSDGDVPTPASGELIALRYRVEGQRKNSIPSLNIKVGSEQKVSG